MQKQFESYLVNTTKRGHINSLTTNSTGTTNTSRIFTRSAVDDSIDQDLDRVLNTKRLTQELQNLPLRWANGWSQKRA